MGRSRISILLYFILFLNIVNCEKVDSDVQHELNQNKTQNVIVECPKSQSTKSSKMVDTILKQIKEKSQNPATTRTDIITELTQQLQDTVFKFLEPVITLLKKLGVRFEVLWISFEICIFDATGDTIGQLVAIGIVVRIRRDRVISQIPPQPPGSLPPPQGNKTWNIGLINARCGDIKCLGEGVIIGLIDTGVRATHVEIKDNWMGKDKDTPYGYLDTRIKKKCEPEDTDGHGTHCVGVACGKNVGVAPLAKWMMCRACEDEGCYESAIKICAIWLSCPYTCNDNSDTKTTKNCTIRPHVINFSLGSTGLDELGEGFYSFYDYVNQWNSLRIISIIAAGNEGPECNTIGRQASYDNTFSVGAVDVNVVLAGSSSIGPAVSTKPFTDDSISVGTCSTTSCGNQNQTCALIKPTVVAPGVLINSSVSLNDTAYEIINGTSMAAPHVVGVVALMICANPTLKWNHKKSYEILTTTTDTSRIDLLGERNNKNNALHTYRNTMCNVMLSDICNTYPNNMYGFGLVDACKAVRKSKMSKS